jgi:hypothetical protein
MAERVVVPVLSAALYRARSLSTVWPTLLAAVAYGALLPLLWLPVVAHTGMAWDTTIVYRTETTSTLQGFLYPAAPLRIYTDVFYQLSYLLGGLFGQAGSWVPFHVVYAMLWWARGLVVYMIAARLLPAYRPFASLAGALAILHGSDKQLNLIGQLDQLGMIFWMLLAVYLFVRALQARTASRRWTWLALAEAAAYLCLWSYEAPLFILLAIPPIFLTVRFGWSRRTAVEGTAFLVVPAIYAAENLKRYVSGSGGAYQESILKSPLTLGATLHDLWINVAHSLGFWSWGTGLVGFPRPRANVRSFWVLSRCSYSPPDMSSLLGSRRVAPLRGGSVSSRSRPGCYSFS